MNARFNRTNNFRLERIRPCTWRLNYQGIWQDFSAASHEQASRVAHARMNQQDYMHAQRAMEMSQ